MAFHLFAHWAALAKWAMDVTIKALQKSKLDMGLDLVIGGGWATRILVLQLKPEESNHVNRMIRTVPCQTS